MFVAIVTTSAIGHFVLYTLMTQWIHGTVYIHAWLSLCMHVGKNRKEVCEREWRWLIYVHAH